MLKDGVPPSFLRKANVAGSPPPVDQPRLAAMPLLKSKVVVGGDGGESGGGGLGDGGGGEGGGGEGDGGGGGIIKPFRSALKSSAASKMIRPSPSRVVAVMVEPLRSAAARLAPLKLMSTVLTYFALAVMVEPLRSALAKLASLKSI